MRDGENEGGVTGGNSGRGAAVAGEEEQARMRNECRQVSNVNEGGSRNVNE